MTALDQALSRPARAVEDPAWTRRLWQLTGGFALAHIVLMLAGITQEVLVEHGASLEHVRKVYGGADLRRVFAGGYAEVLSFFLLLAAIVLLTRVYGARTETGRLATQLFAALGVVFVASTLAVGFAPGAAALYGAQHGVDAQVVATVNDIRNFAYMIQVATQGAMALALGCAAISERLFTKWVGWLGISIGALILIITPFAHNAGSLVWMIWWIGLAVLLLRGRSMTGDVR